MTTKLYVTNLSRTATLSSVRQCFSACGEVVDVEFLAERNPRPTVSAHVVMGNGASAERAIDKLHGVALHDRMLIVSLAPGATTHDRKPKVKGDAEAAVRITQQYRDRHGMFYELDSAGLRVTFKFVFPLNAGEDWRVQATAAGDLLGGAEATAHSRELAFTALAERCELEPGSTLARVSWLEAAAALKSVRAI